MPVLITMSIDHNWRAFGVGQRCDYIGSGDCRGGLAIIVGRREDDYDSLMMGEALCEDCSWNGTAEDAVLVGPHLYVAAGSAGLRVYDVTAFPEMSYLGSFSYPLQGEIVDVEVAGERGLVAAKSEGLRVVDIADPLLPSEIGFYRSPDAVVRSVVTKDDLAYVAATNGLKILDISKGNDPEAIGGLTTAGFCWGVAVGDNYAYLSVVESARVSGDDNASGLWVVDVRNPASPRKVGAYPDLAVFPSDPSVVQDYLFTTDFVVVDLTMPTALRSLGALPISGRGFRAVTIAGQYAYVAAGSGGVLVIDIRDPMIPVEVARYEMLPAANDVRIVDGYAYVAAGDAGLSVLNVADPSRLIEVVRVDTPGYAHSVQVLQDGVYVADGLAGLVVLSP